MIYFKSCLSLIKMSLSSHQRSIGKSQEWLTPQWILEPLGEFDLDPCAPICQPWKTAQNCFTILDNGLDKEWFGRVWLNPPFNRYEVEKWLRKMAIHNNGVALLPARTETNYFQKYILKIASGILFISKRPHFCYIDGSMAKFNSGAPICLIAYNDQNLEILYRSNLGLVLKR